MINNGPSRHWQRFIGPTVADLTALAVLTAQPVVKATNQLLRSYNDCFRALVYSPHV